MGSAGRDDKEAYEPMARRKAKLKNAAEAAQSTVVPKVEHALERVGPITDQASKKLAAAMVLANEASKPYRAEAKKRGRNAYDALRGFEPEPPKRRHRVLGSLLIVAAIGGAAAVAYRFYRSGSTPPWMPKEPADGRTESKPAASTDTTTDKSAAGSRIPGQGGSKVGDPKSAGTTGTNGAREPIGVGVDKNATRDAAGRNDGRPSGMR